MAQLQYGLVAYVSDPIGQFVQDLRRQLQPEEFSPVSHISILPPRPLLGAEAEALTLIEEQTQHVEPFHVGMGDVESFTPRTPVVFIRVAHAAYRMRELHDRLNTSILEFDEPWPYMPHLTLIRLSDEKQARVALRTAQERWTDYPGSRRVRIDELTFVRGSKEEGWCDIASIRLGRRLAPV